MSDQHGPALLCGNARGYHQQLHTTNPTHPTQNECQVSLNTVDNLDTFLSDINHGRWDIVLPQVALLKLPRRKLEDLYEQVLCSVGVVCVRD